MSYLKHIDGIRAIAVFSIVLFHADFKIFEGGYIGVDIFFVISGFLITRLILIKIKQNNFSLKEFFSRRIKRLMPVLFFVKIFILIFGYFIMSPYEYFSLIDQLIYSTFFLSNIYLWTNSDYFSVDIFENPIVHTWSLSLEEQFYLFFPLLIIFVIRFFNKKYLSTILILIGIFSLSLAQFGGNLNFNKPYIEEKILFFNQPIFAGYFMPFGRIWEFLFGSILFINKERIEILLSKKKSLFSIIGFFLIIIPIFVYDESYLFPSIYTLIPVVGTSLLIVTFDIKNFIFKILCSRHLVYTGLISYSFYLWHQPLFAFYKIYFFDNIRTIDIFLLLIVSYLLSIFTYNFIEQPVRKKYLDNNIVIIIFLIFISIVYLGLNKLNSQYIQNKITQNYEKKIPETNQNLILDKKIEIERFKNIILNEKFYFKKNTDKVKILIIGDSMATNWVDAINNNFQLFFKNYEFEHKILEENCIKFLKNIKNTHPTCQKDNEKFLEYISQINLNNVDLIYFVSGWDDQSLQNVYYLINYLSEYKNKLVLVGSAKFTDILRSGYTIAKNKNLKKDKLFYLFFKKIDKTNTSVNEKLKNIATKHNIKFFDEYSIYCKNKKCKIFDDKYNLYFWDSGHLTIYGSKFFGQVLFKLIYKNK